jgi:hypothetical protein
MSKKKKGVDADQIRQYVDIAAAIGSAHAIEILSCFENAEALGTSELEEMINSRFGLSGDDQEGDADNNTQAVYGSKLRNPLMKLENVGLLSKSPKNDGTRAQNFHINRDTLNGYRTFLEHLA